MKHVVVITDCADIAYNEIRARIFSEVNSTVSFEIEPVVTVTNLSVLNAAFAIRLLIDSYPKGTIFQLLCSPEKALHERLIVRTKNGQYIVAGNNGSLSLLVNDKLIEDAVSIPRDKLSTFGGRDVYAKYIAYLLSHSNPDLLLKLPHVIKFKLAGLYSLPDLYSRIVHIDNFGLVKVNIESVDTKFKKGNLISIAINKKQIGVGVFAERFPELDTGTLVVYGGSSLNNLLEFATVRKDITKDFPIKIGDKIEFKRIRSAIKAVFFDFSGTLVERNNLVRFNLQDFLSQSKVNSSPAQFNQVFQEAFLNRETSNLDQVVRDLAKKVRPQNPDLFLKHQLSFLKNLTENLKVSLEIRNLIDQLSKQANLGILSNTDSISYKVLDDLNFRNYFKYHLPSFITGLTKPDRAAFENVLKVTGLKPYEILVIGDNEPKDLETARQLGMFTIQFTNINQLQHDLTLFNMTVNVV